MALNPKPLLLALVAGAALSGALRAESAQAVESSRGNPILKKYCTGDYLSYCGNLAPDDPATDVCFKTNWAKLSENCRRAIDAYETPKPATTRKRG